MQNQFNLYITYIQVVLKRILKHILTARNIHILFDEQVVYGKGTKKGKRLTR